MATPKKVSAKTKAKVNAKAKSFTQLVDNMTATAKSFTSQVAHV